MTQSADVTGRRFSAGLEGDQKHGSVVLGSEDSGWLVNSRGCRLVPALYVESGTFA